MKKSFWIARDKAGYTISKTKQSLLKSSVNQVGVWDGKAINDDVEMLGIKLEEGEQRNTGLRR